MGKIAGKHGKMTAHYHKNNDEKGKRLTILWTTWWYYSYHMTELPALKQTIVENIGSCGKKEFSW